MRLQETLPRSFYARKATAVAKELLGKILVHTIRRAVVAGRIVETEAYLGREDPCSHAFRGPTPRASIMFGPPGRAYVYFVYGNHFCFNVVTHDGGAGAVLVRAIEPVTGIPEMKKQRNVEDVKNLANGPGKLTQALFITKKQNGADLTRGRLLILDAPKPSEPMIASSRVGIRVALEKRWRFSLKGNSFVSRPIPR